MPIIHSRPSNDVTVPAIGSLLTANKGRTTAADNNEKINFNLVIFCK
jgi:hypothetical protein